MNSYIYPLIVNCVKLEERFVIYIKCIASVTSMSFQKIFWLAYDFTKLLLTKISPIVS